MNWSGNTSKPIRSAEWRSPTKRISTPRSVHPCANYKTTPRKSAPSTKSQLSNTPHESEPTYGLINTCHYNCVSWCTLVTVALESHARALVWQHEPLNFG